VIGNFQIVFGEWRSFAEGFFNTVWICAVSGAAALALAVPISMLLRSRREWLRRTMGGAVDVMRAIPFLMLLFIIYYCLPAIGLRLSAWTCGLVGLTVYNAAYFAEILRGAWAHLPREQEEAGRAFGMSGARLYLRIVFPQIFIAAGPVLSNQFITLIKNSAFLMVITIPDLTFMANKVQAIHFIPFETLLTAVALYWVLCFTVERMAHALERVAAVRGNE
jgi:polar amino acid transport system permease protein